MMASLSLLNKSPRIVDLLPGVKESTEMLLQTLASKFETSPRLSVVVTATTVLVATSLVWSTVSAVFWPLSRRIVGSVAGTVTSVRGLPVPNVIVLFLNENAGVGTSGRTDALGKYRAHGIEPGAYAVAIQPIVDGGDRPLTKEEMLATRGQLEELVPLKFQEAMTSGLTVDLEAGHNLFNVDLTGKR
jgi:hypothetical protein